MAKVIRDWIVEGEETKKHGHGCTRRDGDKERSGRVDDEGDEGTVQYRYL